MDDRDKIIALLERIQRAVERTNAGLDRAITTLGEMNRREPDLAEVFKRDEGFCAGARST